METIRVKQCVVDGKKVFGLTNGKKWFFYAYTTKERAEGMIQHFTAPKVIEVNISQPQAYKIVEDK